MNDTGALAISLLALLVSVISTFISIRLQLRSGRESALNQLGEITQKIIDAIAESNALNALDPSKRDSIFFSKMNAINYKLSHLARQADYLIELESPIVSDVQYSLIAGGLAQIGDFEKAQRYWKLAVEKAPGDFYKVVNLRGFATFLFSQNDYKAGATRYQEALGIWENDTNFHKYHNGYTYQLWYIAGMQNYCPKEETDAHYEQARATFETIDNEGTRKSSLYDLETVHSAMMRYFGTPVAGSMFPSDGTTQRVPGNTPPKPN